MDFLSGFVSELVKLSTVIVKKGPRITGIKRNGYTPEELSHHEKVRAQLSSVTAPKLSK
jgi:hypothetical protein